MGMRKFGAMATALAIALSLVGVANAAKPVKVWNIYQDKQGVYNLVSTAPKGQTFIAGPYATKADGMVVMTTPPSIEYTLTPATPTGLNGWYTANVTLVWNVTVPTPNKLTITGGVDQNITADQQATDYTCSATAIGGSAGPVTVSIKRDATKPVITWDSLIDDGASFYIGEVPAEPTVQATDATSGVDSINLAGYETTVGQHTLTATATDLAGNTQVETRTYTVTLKPATVVAPTAFDQTYDGGFISGGITIPSVVGADYFIDGTLAAAGVTDLPPGGYQVTAQAQTDYELVGYPAGGWALTINAAVVLTEVTPIEPTVSNESADGTVPGGITIPTLAGVDYFIEGTAAGAGFHALAVGSYEVTVAAQQGYVLVNDTSPWTLVVGKDAPLKSVQFVAAAVAAQAGTTVALPSGWQPGDLSVVMYTRNATPNPPLFISGYTGWATATSGGTGTATAGSRLVYRVLQTGDTQVSFGSSIRAAVVLVYRNATPGAALGSGSLSGTLSYPALTLQNTSGSSWVGATGWSFGANVRDATAPAGMVNRTTGLGGGAGMGGFDTNGGVTSWAQHAGIGTPTWNSFSFELKVTP